MKFRTVIFLDGNNTGIVVPPEQVEQLGGGKRPAVTVSIGSFSYRSTIASMGGQFLIPLSAARRAESGIKGGDEVEVDLVLDTAPREVEVPDDLAEALSRDTPARTAFEALSYSGQLRHVLSVTDAKTEETRARRIQKVLDTLRA